MDGQKRKKEGKKERKKERSNFVVKKIRDSIVLKLRQQMFFGKKRLKH